MTRAQPLTLNFKLLLLVVTILLAACAQSPTVPQAVYASHQNACVVLVHGLWRSSAAMDVLEKDLATWGYQTVNIDYPSTKLTIPELSEGFLAPAVARCEKTGAETIHLVGHSMGAILIRQYLQAHRLPGNGRVVMLSPPNQGSELSEKFGDQWWYQFIVGPAGSSLSNEEGGFLNSLNPIPEPVGIIAAYRDWSLWPATWLPEPNDGTVSTQSMKLAEMDGFVLVNSGHAMMRYHDDTQRYVRQFLEKGAFSERSAEAETGDTLLTRSEGIELDHLGLEGAGLEISEPDEEAL